MLTHPTCIWRLRWNDLDSLGYRVALFAWSYTFGRFSRRPTCDRQTDRQTDTRRRHFPTLVWRRAVKISYLCSKCFQLLAAKPPDPWIHSPQFLLFSQNLRWLNETLINVLWQCGLVVVYLRFVFSVCCYCCLFYHFRTLLTHNKLTLKNVHSTGVKVNDEQ